MTDPRPLPVGFGWDDAGSPVPVAMPPEELGDRCPHCQKPYDEPDAGQAVRPADMNPLMRAVEHGKTEGQRELLQRLFRGATTGNEIIERAALMAFTQAWPGDACPLTAGDLAAFTGVSERTAARRAANARLAGRFADE